MRTRVAGGVLIVLYSLAAATQTAVPKLELRNVVPQDAKVEQFALTSDGQRTYFTTPSGDIWLYDRGASRKTRLVEGNVWDLAISASHTALVFTRGGTTRSQQHVWTLPLDPKTGWAAGSARRVSAQSGDTPSISPDGRWIAFAEDAATGVAQSVVVVSISGGAERVVASGLPSSVASIRWTPDGSTLYFGVNPPVPFTCAESCLSIPGGAPPSSGTIRRVSVNGGAVDIVATTGSPFPGLSPDGRLLAFAEATGNRQFAVADLTGRRLTTFTLPMTETLQGWTGNSSSLLTFSAGTIRRLRAVSVSDGQSRTLFENNGFTLEPRWSPDGTTVSVMYGSGDRCDLRIMQLDGSVKATHALPARCGTNAAWTPDQRTLVFTRYPQNGPPVITALDVATGQTKDLRNQPAAEMGWVLDRDVVVIAEIAGAETAAAARRVSFWQVDLAGKSTLLREVPFDEPSGSMAVPLDRSSALVWRSTPGEVRFVALDGRSADRVVLPARKGFVLPRPALSPDREWVAFRINPSGDNSTRMNIVELVRLDSAASHAVELPFFVHGSDTLKILPGAKGFVVAERPSRGVDPAIYLVDVVTQAAKKLFDYDPRGRLPELAPSPDGRTVLTLTTEMLAPSITAMDFSGVK